MKAWRKHNMKQAAIVAKYEKEIVECQHSLRFFSENEGDGKYYSDTIANAQVKIKQAEAFKLRTKHERRTHYAAEVATPSQNLYLIMAHARLPVPEEFMSQILMQVKRQAQQNAARSTASNPST
jgi:hypothetical protein